MKAFRDNANREWTVEVNVEALKRVKSLLDVDLLNAAGGKLLERLIADPVLLCDVVYCLVKPQADQAGVPDEDFGRAMAGDAIDAATSALLEELVGFFPQARRRVLAKAVQKMDQLQDRIVAGAEELLDSPEIEQRIDAELEAIRSTLGRPSTSSPASSESIPPG